jgi:hypothetical protein
MFHICNSFSEAELRISDHFCQPTEQGYQRAKRDQSLQRTGITEIAEARDPHKNSCRHNSHDINRIAPKMQLRNRTWRLDRIAIADDAGQSYRGIEWKLSPRCHDLYHARPTSAFLSMKTYPLQYCRQLPLAIGW